MADTVFVWGSLLWIGCLDNLKLGIYITKQRNIQARGVYTEAITNTREFEDWKESVSAQVGKQMPDVEVTPYLQVSSVSYI